MPRGLCTCAASGTIKWKVAKPARRALALLTGRLRLLKRFQGAISPRCEVLSAACLSGIVQVFPQHRPPFQRCQLRPFGAQAPAVRPRGEPEMPFVVGHLRLRGGDDRSLLRKGHGGGTGRGGPRVPVAASGQPRLSLWPPDLAGRGMELPHGAWGSNTAAASGVPSFCQGGHPGEGRP